jgi:Fur family transcriptional regulator, ferric uptake regulator
VSKPQAPLTIDSGDTTTVEGVLDIVRKQGGRITSSRRLLLRALFETKGHHTAEDLAAEVQKQAPDIHLSTIYRNLGHGPATYHLASSAHGHFVCEECGKMIEAPDALFGGLAKDAKARFGFTIDPHHFAMLGRCADCS